MAVFRVRPTPWFRSCRAIRSRGSQIRASVGLYNNQADIDHLLTVMARLA